MVLLAAAALSGPAAAFYPESEADFSRAASDEVRASLVKAMDSGKEPTVAPGSAITVECPKSTIVEEDPESDPPINLTIYCTWRYPQQDSQVRYGAAAVELVNEQLIATLAGHITYPAAYTYCGAYGTRAGSGRATWGTSPVFGAVVEAWAKGVSCRVARRVVLSEKSRKAGGYRCKNRRVGYESGAGTCRKGSRTISYRSGA